MNALRNCINQDQDIYGGKPVFNGTRVPVESLFDYLSGGDTLAEFLDDFPSVTKEQAISVLGIANKIMMSGKVEEIFAKVESADA